MFLTLEKKSGLCDHLNENLYFFVNTYEKVYMYTEIAHTVCRPFRILKCILGGLCLILLHVVLSNQHSTEALKKR